MRRVLLVALVVAASCGAALWLSHDGEVRPHDPPGEPSPAVTATEPGSRVAPAAAGPPANPPVGELTLPDSEKPRIQVMPSKLSLQHVSEAKDQGSFEADQKIAQFLASQPRSAYFDVTSIDCRQTVCEIRAMAFDESAFEEWAKTAERLHQQPWNTFKGPYGTDSAGGPGRVQVRMMLQRQ